MNVGSEPVLVDNYKSDALLPVYFFFICLSYVTENLSNWGKVWSILQNNISVIAVSYSVEILIERGMSFESYRNTL